MTQLALMAIQAVAIPIIQGVAKIAIKKLKKSKNGIPKDMAIVLLKAIADSEANDITHDDLKALDGKINH